jgi:hypothetical protein
MGNKCRPVFTRFFAFASNHANTLLGGVILILSMSSDRRTGLISTIAQAQALYSFNFCSSLEELGFGIF